MRKQLRLALCGFLLAAAPAAQAQTGPTSGPTVERGEPPALRPRPKREPSAGQIALRERQKKCGVEWRQAKADGKTDGLRWPQYWSKCNSRLKGNQA